MLFNSSQPTTETPPRALLFLAKQAQDRDAVIFAPSDDNYVSPEWGGCDWGDAIGDDYDGADLKGPAVSNDNQLARLFDGVDDVFAAELRARHRRLYALNLAAVGLRRPALARRERWQVARRTSGGGRDGDPERPLQAGSSWATRRTA